MYKTLKETAEFLGKSEKTISRWIKAGYLKPETVKSPLQTKQYRFLTSELEKIKADIEASRFEFNAGHDKTEQNARQNKTGQDMNLAFLYSEIAFKNRQIEDLSRSREDLTKAVFSLQTRLLQIEAPKKKSRSLEILLGVLLVALGLFFFFNLYPLLKTLLKG